MTDTPDHIKKIQLEIWLAKPPMERLRQFLIDNDALFAFWKSVKEQDGESDQQNQPKQT